MTDDELSALCTQSGITDPADVAIIRASGAPAVAAEQLGRYIKAAEHARTRYPESWDSPAIRQMRDQRQQAEQQRTDAEQARQAVQRVEHAHPGGSPQQQPNPDEYPSYWLPTQGVSDK